MSELFVEFICEEIPARMQKGAIAHMKQFLLNSLSENGLLDTSSICETKFAIAPRHMAVSLSSVIKQQEDKVIEKRGPKIDAPNQAIEGFCKSNDISFEQLIQKPTDKGEFYFAEIEEKGKRTEIIIPGIIHELVSEFPWPKSQRWGTSKVNWVRPLHYINVVLDGKVLQGSMDLGGDMIIDFTNMGFGHSFYHKDSFEISGFDAYVSRMRELDVLVDVEERRSVILDKANKIAEHKGLRLRSDEILLEEVCGLVECPNVLCGEIDPKFMSLPDEVLATSMRVHQKYFVLEETSGKIAPFFLIITNRKPNNQKDALIKKGNERVLRARLSDALFFWEVDQTQTLKAYREKLSSIMFHKGLGQLSQKVDRLEGLAALIATYIPECSSFDASQAASFSKSDLVTGMVSEFPELQGIMGSYYAMRQSIPLSQALAIRDHYLPKGIKDKLPETAEGIAVSMADKIDTLVGFFGLDIKPTGSKDPFALRRAALAILRMIDERSISIPLDKIFEKAANLYSFKKCDDELALFITERLKVKLRDKGISHDIVSAAIIDGEIENLHRQIEKVKAIDKMLNTPLGIKLLEGYKRAANLVLAETKQEKVKVQQAKSFLELVHDAGVDKNLLKLPAERELFQALAALPDEIGETQNLISQTIERFSFLNEPITTFFETVKVNDEDSEMRGNRLNLLSLVCKKIELIADFKKIER